MARGELKNYGPHTHGNIVHNSLIPDTVSDMHVSYEPTLNSFNAMYIMKRMICIRCTVRDQV